jgi:steroid 5-alpha reductase family enzyme
MYFFTFDTYGLLSTFIIIMVVQLFFFMLAALLKSDKFTDITYALTFVGVTLFLLVYRRTFFLLQILAALCITAWGVRLGAYLFYRIMKIKKDKRFNGMRENFLRFLGFWLLQGVTVFAVLAPAIILLYMNVHVSLVRPLALASTLSGALLWLGGFIIETAADCQKFSFKNNPQNRDRFIRSGLWKYSRHPNYFGEILCWWGIFLIAAPYLHGLLWFSVIGPVFLTFMLIFVSGVRLLEKKYAVKFKNDEAYKRYKETTSMLVLLPPRKIQKKSQQKAPKK